MKLGTKIILGFVMTSVIFMVLVGVVFMFMRPVQFGSTNLSENVLPLLDEASGIQYNVAMQNFQMRTYLMDSSNSDEIWSRVTMRGDNMRKIFSEVQDNLNSPNGWTINIPEVTTPFQALRADYEKYQQLYQDVPVRQKAMAADRLNVVEGYDKFVEIINKYISLETDAQTKEIRAGEDASVILRRSARIAAVNSILDHSGQIVINTLRGVVNNDDQFFAMAKKSVDAAIKEAEALDADTRTQEAKTYTQDILAMLKGLNSVLDQLIANNHASLQATAARGQLNFSISDNADKLKEIGNKMAFQVAEESSAAAKSPDHPFKGWFVRAPYKGAYCLQRLKAYSGFASRLQLLP